MNEEHASTKAGRLEALKLNVREAIGFLVVGRSADARETLEFGLRQLDASEREAVEMGIAPEFKQDLGTHIGTGIRYRLRRRHLQAQAGGRTVMHIHIVEERGNEIVDVVHFCSDACHQDWCNKEDEEYSGWHGAEEGGDEIEYCANCGTICWWGLEASDTCECQRENVVINRFLTVEGVKCEHENWIQLPERMLGRP